MVSLSRQPWFLACRPFEEFLTNEFLAQLKHCRSLLAVRVDMHKEWGMPSDIEWTAPMTLAFAAHMSTELGQALVPKSFRLDDLTVSPDPSEPGVLHVSGTATLVLARANKTPIGRKWMERAFEVTRRAAAYVAQAETGHVVVDVKAKEEVCTEAVAALMKENGLRNVRVARASERRFVFSW
jgi:hypothetical protein